MDLSNVSLLQVGLGAIVTVAIVVIAIFLWRTLKQALGGCLSAGVGCLALVVGLVGVALFFLNRAGITSVQDLVDLFEGLF